MTTRRRTTLVVADKPGRLGNQLLVFANLIAVAIERDYRVLNPAFEDYASLFTGPEGRLFISFPPCGPRLEGKTVRKAAYFIARICAWSSKRIPFRNSLVGARELGWLELGDLSAGDLTDELERRRVYFLQGWLYRDAEALRRQASVVREYFRLRDGLATDVELVMAAIRRPRSVLVGIHIRRGDFKIWPKEFYYSVAQYIALMEGLLLTMAPDKVTFLVASDENLMTDDFAHLPVTFAPGVAIIDLYSLANCDLIVGPPSSFSMWASFIGNVPLNIVTNPERPLTLQDFRVIPDLADDSIAYLHWGAS